MENYIVRVYRRDSSDPDKLTGVCESVEQETQDTFHSIGKLMSLISPQRVAADDNDTGDGSIPETQSKVISLAD